MDGLYASLKNHEREVLVGRDVVPKEGDLIPFQPFQYMLYNSRVTLTRASQECEFEVQCVMQTTYGREMNLEGTADQYQRFKTYLVVCLALLYGIGWMGGRGKRILLLY